MMKITFLGTGTSTGVPQIGCDCAVCRSVDPRDRRLRTSLLVEVDGVRILLDCGPDFREQMLRLDDFRRIDAVLISHEHYDHVGGLDDLRPFCRFGDVDVFALGRTADQIVSSMPYCFREKLYPGVPRLNLHRVEAGDVFFVGGVRVEAVGVLHGGLSILGYRVGDMAFLTDMSGIDEGELCRLRGLRVLVVGGLRHKPHGSHQTIEQACAFAGRLGVERSYIIHMSHHISLHAVEDSLLPEGVCLAYDGLVVCV